jgi:hypothetical protein
MTTTVKKRVVKASGWGLVKRMIKPIPIIGSVVAIGLIAYEIRKKGFLRGAVHVGLDATPVVGTAKNVLEIFTGDLIPDKPVNDVVVQNASGNDRDTRLNPRR